MDQHSLRPDAYFNAICASLIARVGRLIQNRTGIG